MAGVSDRRYEQSVPVFIAEVSIFDQLVSFFAIFPRDTVLLSKRIGIVFAQRTWLGLLAQRTPPLRAARSGAAWADG
jgi:hypothetical protein